MDERSLLSTPSRDHFGSLVPSARPLTKAGDAAGLFLFLFCTCRIAEVCRVIVLLSLVLEESLISPSQKRDVSVCLSRTFLEIGALRLSLLDPFESSWECGNPSDVCATRSVAIDMSRPVVAHGRAQIPVSAIQGDLLCAVRGRRDALMRRLCDALSLVVCWTTENHSSAPAKRLSTNSVLVSRGDAIRLSMRSARKSSSWQLKPYTDNRS